MPKSAIMRLLFLVIALSQFAFSQVPQPDAQEIIRQSVSHWRRNIDAARNYTFQQRSIENQLNKDGSVKKTEIKTYQISIIYGEPYEKLIARDDKPLSEKDQRKEDEKLDKFFEKRKNMSEADREREEEKKYDKFRHEIADELPVMLSWQVAGEDVFHGQPVWILSATPRTDYHPTSRAGKLLSKLNGRVWITKDDYQWVKAEADLTDDFSVGWFLFKLHKGAHLEFEQTRVNEEIWLPSRIFVEGSGRVAVVAGRFRNSTEYSNYQRFSTDVKITGVAPETAAPSNP